MKFNEKYCELEERVEIIKISNGNVEIVGEIRRKYFKYRTKYFCPLWRAIPKGLFLSSSGAGDHIAWNVKTVETYIAPYDFTKPFEFCK